MGILLPFTPFILYVVIERLVGIKEGLLAATITSVALLVRDAISHNRAIKLIELGTLALFGSLTIYTLIAGAEWPIPAVRLRVDSGILLIILISLAIRHPFTLQYAREKTPRDLWTSPEFIRTNYIITTVWAIAFAVMVAADTAVLYVPTLPPRFVLIVTILATYAAVRFTLWYPQRKRAKLSS